MESITLARVIHVLGVIIWIGGVAMVTTVLIPAIRRNTAEKDQLKFFRQIEGRFSVQARITTLITGLSGFYMLYVLDGWNRYLDYRFWWVHAMTFVWLLFTLILFVLEPLVFPRLLRKNPSREPGKAFRIMHRVHWILLLLSLITVVGAVAGSHGWLFIR